MIRLIDITPPTTSVTPVFPGDEPFALRLTESVLDEGASNVSVVTSSLHNGAHVDAPLHLFSDGADIASMPLELFVGVCFVAEVDINHRQPVEFKELPKSFFDDDGLARCQRLLIKTRRVQPLSWTAAYRALAPSLVRGSFNAGVRLIGVDVPSIDPADSEALPAHREALSKSMPILEDLNLCAVEPGFYELIALPMKWPGAEASPVRAVLRAIGSSSVNDIASKVEK